MKFAWPQPATLLRYGWAALGGAALACAFPKVGLAGLAWVAPGWLLFGALAARGNEAFRVGFVGGLAYSLVAFYWLLLIPFPAGAIAGWLALSAYLGLYVGAWVWLSWKGFPAGEKASFPLSPLHQPTVPSWLRFSRTDLLLDFAGSPLITRAVWALWGATVWVALEMLQARLFTGFPWNLLGVSQYQILPVVQLASVTGVYGISFLLIWFSIAAASAVAQVLTAPDRPRGWVGDLVLPLLSLAAVLFFGASELAKRTPPERSVTAVLVQPSIPQTLIWDPNQNATRFAQLIQLSERALRETTNAQILVWPEASVPNMLRYERETYEAVTNLAIVHQVWIILGSDDAAPRPGSTTREVDYYNSSFLITPRGELAATYQKRKLVIFGEYIPLERWFPFMKWLTPVEGSFTPGQRAAPFLLPELPANISILICFEDIFPHHVREYVEGATDFLLNLTNNGWFGESAAQWQHAANAALRSVENRIPLVRCANNGLTCWVDAYGGMHGVDRDNPQSVYGAGYKVVAVPLLREGAQRPLTFYTRHGDCFGWSCVMVTVARLLAFASGHGRRPSRARTPSSPAVRGRGDG